MYIYLYTISLCYFFYIYIYIYIIIYRFIVLVIYINKLLVVEEFHDSLAMHGRIRSKFKQQLRCGAACYYTLALKYRHHVHKERPRYVGGAPKALPLASRGRMKA